ncbi:hypothetical protein RE6C_01374 [Rhodopirellula europaea 6C]|uniref:Uncharacterized protein n=1 Tax=Rhodopirellula europaea 6C TaxID=1263867 RepID=M2B876_9BACT|nr:hypothetical protein RE6C_01374 [Rhodopirellula europaea 6C]
MCESAEKRHFKTARPPSRRVSAAHEKTAVVCSEELTTTVDVLKEKTLVHRTRRRKDASE